MTYNKPIHDEGKRFNVLFRIIRCLDCIEIPTRLDNDCISIMTTQSDLNTEIKAKIKILDQSNHSLEDICQELKYMYGNHVIANRRDRYTRTVFDY